MTLKYLCFTNLGEDRMSYPSSIASANLEGGKMINRNTFVSGIVAVFAIVAMGSPVLAAPKKEAASSSWDGTWSGTSSGGGRTTTVKISGGKVTFWTNNGFPRPKVSGAVNGSKVSLDDNNGWKGTMTLTPDGKARISASGIGNNGKPASNSATLYKR